MVFEIAEAWPDAKEEFRPVAELAKDGNVVRVNLNTGALGDENPEKFVARMRAALTKFGRFEIKTEGAFAYVRSTDKPKRTRGALSSTMQVDESKVEKMDATVPHAKPHKVA